MGGSLWRQAIGADEAVELTHAAGAYDYQPDVVADGRSVVFSRYDGDAIELWRLDLASGREQQLTSGGAVNVEPRLSPDGKRIAWVSTQGTGHFNLFVADIGAGRHQPTRVRCSASARARSRATTIRPTTTRSIRHGRRTASASSSSPTLRSPGAPATSGRSRSTIRTTSQACCSEETSWSARPELAPDGAAALFASYHGRQMASAVADDPRRRTRRCR